MVFPAGGATSASAFVPISNCINYDIIFFSRLMGCICSPWACKWSISPSEWHFWINKETFSTWILQVCGCFKAKSWCMMAAWSKAKVEEVRVTFFLRKQSPFPLGSHTEVGRVVRKSSQLKITEYKGREQQDAVIHTPAGRQTHGIVPFLWFSYCS